MKIKNHKGNLEGLKVKTPKGVVGFWKSQWQQGVWFSDGESTRIYPQFVDDLKDCLEWEITNDDINCNEKVDVKFTDNKDYKL